ncbi:MAG TPA: sulfatase-like hydrolase/transferase [Fimbriimonadaceae bacterium]|nr:sulfatase-like hydrolase/transferase [Fimbriimonadaceae bacterium]
MSLANLLFFRAWPWLQNPYTAWHLKAPVSTFWWETILDVFIVAAVLFIAQATVRRIPWKGSPLLIRFGLLAALALILKRLNEVNSWLPLRPILVWLGARGKIFEMSAVALAGVLMIASLVALGRIRPLVRWLGIALALLSPLFFLNVYGAAKATLGGDTAYRDLPACTHAAPQAPGPRVVWLIFDTLDYHYAFEERPSWLKLPELDRLRRESVDFPNALSPAERTEKSIPSLLTGLVVTGQSITSPCDYRLTLANGSKIGLRGLPTIFQQAENMGVRTAALGVYIPYGRLLGDQLSYCRWWQWGNLFDSVAPISASLVPQMTLAVGKPFSMWTQIGRQIRNHLAEVEEAKNLVAGDDYRLVYAHFFPPHMPPMYDGKLDRFSRDAYWHPDGYHDALALADRTLGELRREMERAGTWDQALVIVTSDHSFRLGAEYGYKVYKRIPFLCHFPGQTTGLVYPGEINTICSHDMILNYLNGDIQTPASFTSWLREWMKTAPTVPQGRDDSTDGEDDVP